MPPPMAKAAHRADPLAAYFARKHRAAPFSPMPDCLVADVDTALGQQVLHIAQGQWEAHVHHHHQRLISGDELK